MFRPNQGIPSEEKSPPVPPQALSQHMSASEQHGHKAPTSAFIVPSPAVQAVGPALAQMMQSNRAIPPAALRTNAVIHSQEEAETVPPFLHLIPPLAVSLAAAHQIVAERSRDLAAPKPPAQPAARYKCTSGCPETFTSQPSWTAHEEAVHSVRWKCACGHTTSSYRYHGHHVLDNGHEKDERLREAMLFEPPPSKTTAATMKPSTTVAKWKMGDLLLNLHRRLSKHSGLKGYRCTSGCASDVIFKTREHWAQHEEREHEVVWTCSCAASQRLYQAHLFHTNASKKECVRDTARMRRAMGYDDGLVAAEDTEERKGPDELDCGDYGGLRLEDSGPSIDTTAEYPESAEDVTTKAVSDALKAIAEIRCILRITVSN